MMIDLNNYRKLKKAQEYVIELNEVRNALMKSANCLTEFCEENNDITKLYNEIMIHVDTYNKLIETYKHHIARMERNNGI